MSESEANYYANTVKVSSNVSKIFACKDPKGQETYDRIIKMMKNDVNFIKEIPNYADGTNYNTYHIHAYLTKNLISGNVLTYQVGDITIYMVEHCDIIPNDNIDGSELKLSARDAREILLHLKDAQAIACPNDMISHPAIVYKMSTSDDVYLSWMYILQEDSKIHPGEDNELIIQDLINHNFYTLINDK